MKSMIRSFTVIMLLALGIVLTTQVVFADEPETATITYVVSEDPLDGLEPMDPPDPVTGIAGRQVHHIPTLSSAVYTFLGWYSLDGETEVPHRKYDVISEDITLYGKWRLTPRVVRYDLDGGINHPDNPHIVYGNETYPLEDPSKTGFVFDGWLLEGSPVTTLESVTTSIDLTATWSIASIDLTLDFANGDPNEVLTFSYGDPYDLTTYEPTRAGYDFDGWLDSGDQVFPATGTITIEADETVTAQWVARTDTEYQIVTHKQNILDDDYAETTETLTGTTGETVSLTPEALTGFVYNESLSTTSGEIQGDGSLTLHVYYDRETYDVSFYDVDDDLIETQSVRYQGDATEPVYSVPGYETSWTVPFTAVTETIDTYAVLTANTYEITFVSETSETFDPQSVTYDQAIGTLPTPQTIPEYKVFNGWKDVGGTPYDSTSIYDVVGDLVLYAEFIEATDVEYYVEYHFEDETGTFVHDPSEDRTLTGTAGDEVTAPALDVVPTGFVLQGSLPTGIITTDGLTLVVNYERITLTVTFSHYEEDVLVDTDVDVKYGLDVVAPTLDVRTGYTFNAWDKTLSDITEAQTITALYDLVTYTITYHYNDEDSFDDEAVHDSPVTTYTIESAEVVLTDPTRTTYTFDGWYDAETGGTLVTSIPSGSTGDVDLYAAWSVITYTVTFDNDPEMFYVEVEISATVPEEDFPDITLPDNKALLYWYYGAEMEFTSDTIVNSDLTVYPMFIDAYDITFLDEFGDTISSERMMIGSDIVAPALPEEDGYDFAWDIPVPATATADYTGQVVRTVIDYEIAYEDLMGSTHTNPLTYTIEDETITLTDPTAVAGFTFDGWFNDPHAGTEVTEIVSGSFGSVVLYARFVSDTYQVVNSGFETGDIYGWNAYQIWKNEAPMVAYEDARVIDGTYFDGNHDYNRDGNYNLGIFWPGADWDQSSERMGHLRSSNFELGGSGWVSFKLGGGRDSSFAYVSVRRTSDDVEVARFGNHNYNDTGIATDQFGSTITNAEAFMFQYYFDLAALDDVALGDSLYFMITDASSYEWSVLSADSFETYYHDTPSPTTDELAINILPNINVPETPTNQIENGYFSSGLDNWEDPTGAFTPDDGAKSGGPETGVLRSSAFSLDGNNIYLRYGWTGGLRYDKQIFISVKEVGTNIEVMRIVRRDNLHEKDGGGHDNHMVDLSGLDNTKLYYLEIADNKGDNYSHVKEVRLIDQTEWDTVVSSDEAVYISGIVTDYTYVPET